MGHRRPGRGPPPGLERRPPRRADPTGKGRAQPRRHRRRPPRSRHARYALWKNPENLTDQQRDKLAWIAKTDPRLHRAYLLKEGLRYVFARQRRSRQSSPRPLDLLGPPLPHPRLRRTSQRRIVDHRATIHAALEHGLSNALIESVNTKIRLLTRIAFGFRSADALIALAMLSLGGHRPALPGRHRPTDQSGEPHFLASKANRR